MLFILQGSNISLFTKSPKYSPVTLSKTKARTSNDAMPLYASFENGSKSSPCFIKY